MAEESNATRSTSGWKTILISALLGIVGTVVATLIVTKLQSREPELTYNAVSGVPFSGANGALSIYQVRISNTGKVEVESVVIIVRVPYAQLEQVKASVPPGLNYSENRQSDTVTITVPNLNPTESVQVSVVASATSALPDHPDVSVRAKGVVGKPMSEAEPVPTELRLIRIAAVTSVSAVGFTLGFFLIAVRRRGLALPFADEKFASSREDQRFVLAYLCRLHGLTDLANEYLNKAAETHYWTECDRLGQLAVESPDTVRESIRRVLGELPTYDKSMGDVAIAVAFYNLARIEASRSDFGAFRRNLAEALKIAPDEINLRLELDEQMRQYSQKFESTDKVS
jgi:uncharacterized membrane protein YeaQ/YmgE (transglycosylase-associated protein family)